MSAEKEVEILTRLGLSSVQARVYLALARSGASKIRRIAQTSSVPRQDIYRILSALQELSLVEKVVATPTMYRAIPMKEAFSMLMERKLKDTSELEAETKKLLNSLNESETKEAPKEEEQQYVMISAKQSTEKFFLKLLSAAQETFDVIIPEEAIALMQKWTTSFKKALKRGVKCRHVICVPEGTGSLPEFWLPLMKNPNFKVRYLPNRPPATITVRDKKEMFVSTMAVNPIKAPGLWSNNPGCLAIINNYFEDMWQRAQEEIP